MTQFNHNHLCFVASFTRANRMDDYKLMELLGVGYLRKCSCEW